MPEEELDAPEVDTGFEEMRREGMPQEMRMDGLGQLGGFPSLATNEPHPIAGDRMREVRAGKEPGLGPKELPVVTQERQQTWGEHHEAIALAFALADADHHARTLDVTGLELAQFRGAEPGGIQGGKDGAVFEIAGSDEQGRHFGPTEDHWQRLLPARIGDILHHPRAAERRFVTKA